MRQLTAMVGALITALALLLLGAPPSAAGGPTSVLLASPTSQRTASLYGTQEQYGRLEKLLAPAAGGELDRSQEEAPEWGEEGIWGEQTSDMVNVTWMVHDVTPWRVDRVYTDTTDTQSVWIHTKLGMGDDADAPGDGVWHRAKQPEELRKLLLGLGVLGTASDEPAQSGPPSTDPLAEARADTGEKTAADKAAATSAPDLADRAWWAIPALGLGLLLGSGGATLLLRRAAARHGSGPPRWPRQKLIDT